MNTAHPRPSGHVIVIGGGISGLAAAHRLLAGGARVTVLEASARLGGKLHAGEIAGVPVDFCAESMLARRPEAIGLAREVGLAERLQPPITAAGRVWTRGGVRPLPNGHVMGVPGDREALADTGVVSEEGLARMAREADLPPAEVGDDVAIGEFVAERFGHEVVDRLVEPLLGGVYAGDAYRISMRAALPQLFEQVKAVGSLAGAVQALLRQRAAQAQQGPVFMGIEGGMGQLPLAVADAVRAAGGEIRTGAPVDELKREAAGWTVVTGGQALAADAVLLAVPAPAAARLLAADSPFASAELATIQYASMALVALAFRSADTATLPEGSGFLVPSVDGHTIKAATFSSRKWGWVRDADPGLSVVRTSIGRFQEEEDLQREDAELVELSLADLGEAVGLSARPVAAQVIRWDNGLPQYPVGHLDKIARVRAELAKLPGLAVCGAAYDGVGIPACIADADRAADDLLGTLLRGVREGE